MSKTARAESLANNCPQCSPFGGFGYVKVYREQGRYGFNRDRYDLERCICQKPFDVKRKRILQQSFSHFGNEMERQTFYNFDQNVNEDIAEAYRVCSNFAADPHGWILLSGSVGLGKTHLLAAIHNKLQTDCESPLYLVVPQWLASMRAAIDSHERDKNDESSKRILSHAQTADVLLFDELGKDRPTPWALEQVFLVLDYRYIHKLPTIVATNIHPQLLARVMSASADRLLDAALTTIVVMSGESYRLLPEGDRYYGE